MYSSSFWFWTFERVWGSRSNGSIVAISGRRDGKEKIDDFGDGIDGCAREDVDSGGLVTLLKLVGNKGEILLDNELTDGKDRMIRIYNKIYKIPEFFKNILYFNPSLYLILI